MLADISSFRSGAVNIEFQVLAFNPAKGTQLFPDGHQSVLVIGITLYCFGDKNADTPRPGGLLRPSSERPHNCAADKCDELAPSHCLPRRLWTDHQTAQTSTLEG